jgi:hypothetical protein
VAVCDGNRAWIEWAGFEKDDHRLVEIVCPRLKCLAIAPEDCFADDGGLGKIVINPFEREGFYLRRIGKTRQRMSLSVDHPLTVSLHALRKPRPARVPKSRARLGSVCSSSGVAAQSGWPRAEPQRAEFHQT